MYNRKTSNMIIGLVLEYEQMNNPDMNILLESDRAEFKHILQNKYGIYVDNETGYIMEADANKLGNGLFSTIKAQLKGQISSATGFVKNVIKSVWRFIKAHWKLITGVLMTFGVAGASIFSAAAKWKQVTGNAMTINGPGTNFKNTYSQVNKKYEQYANSDGTLNRMKQLYSDIINTYKTGYDQAKSIIRQKFNEQGSDKNIVLKSYHTLITATQDMIGSTKQGLKSMSKFAKNYVATGKQIKEDELNALALEMKRKREELEAKKNQEMKNLEAKKNQEMKNQKDASIRFMRDVTDERDYLKDEIPRVKTETRLKQNIQDKYLELTRYFGTTKNAAKNELNDLVNQMSPSLESKARPLIAEIKESARKIDETKDRALDIKTENYTWRNENALSNPDGPTKENLEDLHYKIIEKSNLLWDASDEYQKIYRPGIEKLRRLVVAEKTMNKQSVKGVQQTANQIIKKAQLKFERDNLRDQNEYNMFKARIRKEDNDELRDQNRIDRDQAKKYRRNKMIQKTLRFPFTGGL